MQIRKYQRRKEKNIEVDPDLRVFSGPMCTILPEQTKPPSSGYQTNGLGACSFDIETALRQFNQHTGRRLR